MPTYLITGCNRGLGLTFVEQLISSPANIIIATIRSTSTNSSALQALKAQSGVLHILICDTSSESSISSFAEQVTPLLGQDSKIDYLINNAGINTVPHETSLTLSSTGFTEQMMVNVFGPAKMVQVLLPHLKNGSVVMNISSDLASMSFSAEKTDLAATAYGISKAGLNMLTVHQARHLRERGVTVVCMHPGWVQTDMGGGRAPLKPEESVSGVLEVLHKVERSDTGKYLNHIGDVLQW
jgi:NAD(P)-dependent dehydrogenase (short-subunit alcohol dehydrogenase family)